MAWNLPHTGELRHAFRFDRQAASGAAMAPVNIGGVIGGSAPITAWTAFITKRSGKLDPIRGGLEVVAERLSNKAIYDLWVRYDSLTSTISADDRAVDLVTGIAYALGTPIDPDQRQKWLLIQATSNGLATSS